MPAQACRGCGGDNPSTDGFCGYCGLRATALEVSTDVSPEPWSCRECGASCRAATAFCGTCGGRWVGTRADDLRLVTALFADISGFTTLADTLEVEDLHDVINPLIVGLAHVAEKYDGFITKYAGDALLVIFGAPVAHEDDAQRALLAALEMHATLPGLLEQLGPAAAHLTIHVGVNTGKVVAGRVGSDGQGDYSVLGDSVILAQRLESVCPSGQTYVGPATFELCKDEFDFESVGELTLKGKLKPVEGHRLVGRSRAGTTTERPLVGRSAELAVVDRVLTLAASSSAPTLVLTGEPGNGKSRLLAEARVRATRDGMRWLPARCLSYGASLPYWPFADLLRQALGLRIEDAPETTRARLAELLPSRTLTGAERLLGLATETVPPEQARREVHDALAAWLAELARSSPVVLSVEDTHWADAATLDVLGELARAPQGTRTAIVLTSRPEGVEPLSEVLSGVEPHLLEVGPLGAQAVAELAEDVLSGPAGPALVDLVTARTGGNPLFVEELTRSLQESGALVDGPLGLEVRPEWDTESVPQTVERVFAARLDLLPPDVGAVLQTMSVIGRTARLSLLRATAEDEVDSAVSALSSAGLLDRVVDLDEPAVTFHHALLQDVAYGRLLRKRRRELHLRVAHVGVSLYGDTDETVDLQARHLYLGDAGAEAVGPLLRAGRRAARLYANAAAALHLQRAEEVLLALPDETQRLVEARTELAVVQEHRGEYGDAGRLFDLLREQSREGRAWAGSAAVRRKQGRFDEALDLLDEGLRAVAAGERVALQLEWARSGLLAGRIAEALGAVRSALAETPRDDVTARGLLLRELVLIESEIDQPEFAVSHGRKALTLLEQSGDRAALASALRIVGEAERKLGRLDDAAVTMARAITLAEQTGHVEEAAGTLVNLGNLHFDRGDLDASLAATQQAAHRFEQLGHATGRVTCYSNMADTLRSLGRADEARGWAERALELARRNRQPKQIAVATVTLAEIELALGEPALARELAGRARASFERLSVPEWIAICDDVLAATQDAALAGAAAEPSGAPD